MPQAKRATRRASRAPSKSVQSKPNPAPFNTDVLYVIKRQLVHQHKLLDPFAGTGKGCDFMAALGHAVIGVELEPEWAMQSDLVEVGNALSLRWRANTFDGIFTSPTYGNRMADHHDAQEICKACKGKGVVPNLVSLKGQRGPDLTCEKCGGKGRRTYKRHTYKHYLERDPSPDSSAILQWGPEYRDFHERAWKEAVRVLKPDGRFVLNISDHYRGGELQPVTQFHIDTLKALGLKRRRKIAVETPRLGHGQNSELRDEQEWVVVFDNAAWSS